VASSARARVARSRAARRCVRAARGCGGARRRPDARPQGLARASSDRPGASGRRAGRATALERRGLPAAVPARGARMTAPLVLAVDGGNFKTDLALVRADGETLALVRGPQSSPHHLGVDGCMRVLEELLATALRESGLPNGRGARADVAQLLLAGVDFPPEEEEVQVVASERGLAKKVSVGNDTFAVLRAGTERGWGVAIVCGSGINCLGVAPDGRHTRFPALGDITGDWGGGYDVGLAAVSAAARSED